MHSHAPDRLSPSRVALVPPSSRLWHSDQKLFEKCSHLHTCTSSMFRLTESQQWVSLVVFLPGRYHPHPDSSRLAHWKTRKTFRFSRKACDERGSVSRLGVSTATARPPLCRLDDVASRPPASPLHRQVFFQSLSALGLHVACLLAVEALSLIVVLCILGLAFALDVLASAFAFALRIRSELH